MTNEELLAKYLESSLSETENAEFQKLLNSSPEFARDVRELSKIEEFLKAGPAISAAVPENFLASVEHHVTEKIHHDKYHAPGSGNAFNKILSGFWIIPMIILLGVGGYFLLRTTDKKVQPQQEMPAPVLKEGTAQTPEIQSIPEQPSVQKEIPQMENEFYLLKMRIKKEGKKGKRQATIFSFLLNLPKLGELEIDGSFAEKKLSANVTASPETIEKLEVQIHFLKTALAEKGIFLSNVYFRAGVDEHAFKNPAGGISMTV